MLKRYLILIICLFISSIYFNLFQLPNKIVTGGSAGVSIIINYWFGIEPSKIIFLISILLLLLDLIILGKYKASGAIIATIIYPMFIDITTNINNYIKINLTNMLIISMIIGIFSGVTTAIVYKIGFSNGGFSILCELISKYFKIPLSFSSFIVNIIIVLLGGFSIGLEMIIYSTIILSIHSIIIKLIFETKKLY